MKSYVFNNSGGGSKGKQSSSTRRISSAGNSRENLTRGQGAGFNHPALPKASSGLGSKSSSSLAGSRGKIMGSYVLVDPGDSRSSTVVPLRKQSSASSLGSSSQDLRYRSSSVKLQRTSASASRISTGDTSKSNTSLKASSKSSSMASLSASTGAGTNQPKAASAMDNPSMEFCQINTASGGLVFAKSKLRPDEYIVYRVPSEKNKNPERLNLDRLQLTNCPILEGEEKLRLLNLQHNEIKSIDNMVNLQNLIFLDLYDNHITKINGLGCLLGLRVLMLGKNRIRTIENLKALTRLDVLDLHGNEIANIENLSHLSGLRVLNLAGNRIEVVDNLVGLKSIVELNFRRNCILKVTGLDGLNALQRLFLSQNNIESLDAMKSVLNCKNLIELTIDGNPLNEENINRHKILDRLKCLIHFDLKRVTEEDRRLGTVMTKKEAQRIKEAQRLEKEKETRERAIQEIKKKWETNSKDALLENEKQGAGTTGKGAYSSKNKIMKGISNVTSLFAVPTGSYIDIHDNCLTVYGNALASLDKPVGNGHFDTIHFQFVQYKDITEYFSKIRTKFPNVSKFIFSETQMSTLKNILELSQLKKLKELTIHQSCNPITEVICWKDYAIYTLSTIGLSHINGHEITQIERNKALNLFTPLLKAVSNLSDIRLENLDSICLPVPYPPYISCLDSSDKNSKWSSKKKNELQYSSLQLDSDVVLNPDNAKFCTTYINSLFSQAEFMNGKYSQLDDLWPKLICALVVEAVKEYDNKEVSYQKCLSEIEASRCSSSRD
eukprot:Nk52_evm20s223 gene=Nk52_evmTU20s223